MSLSKRMKSIVEKVDADKLYPIADAEITKGFDRVFKSIFPIEDLNDKATLEYVSYRLEKPKFDVLI